MNTPVTGSDENYQQALDLLVGIQRAANWLREGGAIKAAVDEFLGRTLPEWRQPWQQDVIGTRIQDFINSEAGHGYAAIYLGDNDGHRVEVFNHRIEEEDRVGRILLGQRTGDLAFVAMNKEHQLALRGILSPFLGKTTWTVERSPRAGAEARLLYSGEDEAKARKLYSTTSEKLRQGAVRLARLTLNGMKPERLVLSEMSAPNLRTRW